MPLPTPRQARGAKGRAVQLGDHDAITRADVGLRAANIAEAIRANTAGAPAPFPPEVTAELCALVLGGAR